MHLEPELLGCDGVRSRDPHKGLVQRSSSKEEEGKGLEDKQILISNNIVKLCFTYI